MKAEEEAESIGEVREQESGCDTEWRVTKERCWLLTSDTWN
jgi:hypothetical protein